MTKIDWAAFIIFLVLSFFGILHHEVWLDEMQRWLIARDSQSIAELFHNKRYEGHPSVWYLILYFVKGFSSAPIAMQICHSLLASISAFIFLRYSSFNQYFRVLFIFGYFQFFEYNLIAANYGLVMLGMFLFCVFHENKKSPLWVFGVLLGLMANSHIIGLFCSSAFFLFLVIERILEKRKSFEFIGFAIIYLCFIGIAIWHSLPPADHPLRINLLSQLTGLSNYSKAILNIEKSFLPIPDFTQHQFWNKYLLTNLFSGYIRVLIVGVLLALSFWILIKEKRFLFLFAIGLLSNILFHVLFPLNGIRYYGFIYLFFIVSCWLTFDRTDEKSKPSLLKTSFLYGLLIIHVFSSMIAFNWDSKNSFSQAPNMAAYVKNHRPIESLILVDDYRSGPPISGYLEEKIYYLDENRIGSFCDWVASGKIDSESDFIARIQEAKKLYPDKKLWLITNNRDLFPLKTKSNPSLRWRISFEGSLYNSHNYHLYVEE